MKKSKFLKKSLAMLLAVMLVVAMIPLSAAAAYEPAYAVKPVSLSGGTPEGSAPTWSIEFPYDATPKMTVDLGNPNDSVTVIKADGSEEPLNITNGFELQRDTETNKPVPFRFRVNNADNTDTSAVYTVNWTMAAAATSGTATKATLDGKYEGRISGSDITFTVPFGYTDTKAYTVKFEGCTQDEISGTFGGTVGTNKKEAKADVIKNTTEDNKTDLSYNVYVVEETGLESITIGDYEGKIEVATAAGADYDKDYETGNITFTIPADLKADDQTKKLNLIPVLEVGSNYASAELGGEDLVSGKEFDFASLLDNSTGETLTLTSTGTYTRTYNVKFVREGSDTTIDAFTANGETGTVNGTNLTATVSKNTQDMTKVTLKVNGPIAYTDGTPTISVVDGTPANFNEKGEATLTVDCSKGAVRLVVVSGDGEHQAYYNLTVTKAEEENNNPQITSAKMTITDDNGEEKEYTASISGLTITFTVPYSTVNADVKNAEYTFAKTALTTVAYTKADFTVKDGGTITATSTDNGNKQVYTVKFAKDAAQTGKSISDFVLTNATNINEVSYNNNVDYDVTVSGAELKVSVPTDENVASLYANFTLSEGAKLYAVPSDPDTALSTVISADFDKKTGEQDGAAAGFTDGSKYVIVDETLAYAIGNDDKASTYTKIKNNFGGHYTEYTFKVTKTALSDAARLTALSADDNAVTSTIGGADADEITLTVPYGYASRETAFFFDFTVSTGARLSVNKVDLISGGEQNWNSDKGQLEEVGNTATNPVFHVAKDTDGKYYLYNASNVKVTTLTVTAQNGTDTKTYTVKDIKTKDANTGALLTSVKVNNTSATINNTAKTVTVSLPFGTNLGQVTLDITASTMAAVSFPNYDPKNPDKTYDIRNGLKITVTSENGATTNVYTLTATTAAQFSDVNTGDWFYQNVMDAVAAGIVSGRGDGTFGPNDRITRRDFAIMLAQSLGHDNDEEATSPFKDVADTDYGVSSIAYLYENEITVGDSNGNFNPDANITRQEAAIMLVKAFEATGTSSDLYADDAQIASWAKSFVYTAKAAGLMKGDDHNEFNPTDRLTRAEAASAMVNAVDN